MYSNKFRRSNGFTLTHREYITDVVAAQTGSFSYAAFNLNPGLSSVFPWLSGAASLFEQYKFQKMCFHYISTSADALTSTNTALGTVILSCDYNAANPPFTSKLQMENSMLTISGKPSQDIAMPVDCHSKQSPLQGRYVRSSGVGLNQDIRFYDHGLFQIATVGGQSNSGSASMLDPYTGTSIVGSNIGELWVEYTVTFYKPILDNDTASKLAYYHFQNDNILATDIGTAVGYVIGGLLAANYLSDANGSHIIAPVPSTATSGAKVVHDDFGLILKVNNIALAANTVPASANLICFPAGSCGGSLVVNLYLSCPLVGGRHYTTSADPVKLLVPTCFSCYPKTAIAATAGIQLGTLYGSSTTASAIGPASGTTLVNSTFVIADALNTQSYMFMVQILDPTKDNYVTICFDTNYLGCAGGSRLCADLLIQQLSGVTNSIGQ